jgi:hypothetical protein
LIVFAFFPASLEALWQKRLLISSSSYCEDYEEKVIRGLFCAGVIILCVSLPRPYSH